MNPFALAIIAGVAGTLVMDAANHALARAGILLKIDIAMIGRMAAGWLHGRFCYRHPGEMSSVRYEKLFGWVVHHAISIVFALVYVIGWNLMAGGPVSAALAFVFGVATTLASQLLVFPAMGFGIFGRHSPEGLRAPLSSLVNHSFFGAGLALVIAVM